MIESVTKALERINGTGDYATLDRVEGLSWNAEPALFGSQYKTLNVVTETMSRILPVSGNQNELIRESGSAAVYQLDALAPTLVDGFAVAFQGQYIVTLLHSSAYDLNDAVKELMNSLAANQDTPFATIANIQTYPNMKVGSGSPHFQADITYHVTLPAISDLSGTLEPPWVLAYDFGYAGLGQRYVNQVGEQHLINFVAIIIEPPNNNGSFPVRDRVATRLLGLQPDPSYGMTELVSMSPVEADGNTNFAFWRAEFQTYKLNYGVSQ